MTIYAQFTPDDIVEANPTIVTTGLWSGDLGEISSSIYASQTQINSSKEYYFDVYRDEPDNNPLAEVQFSVAYGHINGGGAPTLNISDQANLPTKAIYSQYRNLLLDPTDTKFTFKEVESDHIYVINFQRARIREQLDPGNWELPLSGANGVITFIDDSGQRLGALTANSKAGRVFNIVSGTISTGTVVTASVNSTSWGENGPGYGLVYPDLGIIVLNPEAICNAVGFFTSASSPLTGSAAVGNALFYTNVNTATLESGPTPYAPVTSSLLTVDAWGANLSAYNHAALFISINLATKDNDNSFGFSARSAETISSTHYFVRLRNRQFNYSNNPTFYNADNGSLTFADFRNNPRVYVTTVGLYNTQNELLAVAKLSKPVRKSFDEEILLRVRLDF